MVEHMMGIELDEFPSATIGRGVLSMVIACVWAHDGQGTVMFPSATIGRGVHSMVIACVPGSKLSKLGCFTIGEESVGLDYEQDWLVGLDHEKDSFVEAQ